MACIRLSRIWRAAGLSQGRKDRTTERSERSKHGILGGAGDPSLLVSPAAILSGRTVDHVVAMDVRQSARDLIGHHVSLDPSAADPPNGSFSVPGKHSKKHGQVLHYVSYCNKSISEIVARQRFAYGLAIHTVFAYGLPMVLRLALCRGPEVQRRQNGSWRCLRPPADVVRAGDLGPRAEVRRPQQLMKYPTCLLRLTTD